MTGRYRPVPGTGRCTLCGSPEDATHVKHPWWQIVRWLWDSHLIWRIYMVFGSTLVLTLVLASIRITVERS